MDVHSKPIPPYQRSPSLTSYSPPSPTLTADSTLSSNLELEPDASDVSSVHSSSEESQEGGIDLAASAWTDLGSLDSRPGGPYSPRASSFASSDDGRPQPGDSEDEGWLESQTAMMAGQEGQDGAGWTDLEPSLHLNKTLSSSSCTSRASDRDVEPSLASSTSTIASHAPTLQRPTLIGQTSLSSSPITEEVMHLSFPDPSTVSSSFTIEASPDSAQTNPRSSSLAATLLPTPSSLPRFSRVDAPYSIAAGAAVSFTPTASWIRETGGPTYDSSRLGHGVSSSARTDTVSTETSPLTSPTKAESLLSSLSTPPPSTPPRIHILYLGSPVPCHYADPLIQTLLTLLVDSRLLDQSEPSLPLRAQLKQYDLLGGAESTRIISDIRQPFRRAKKETAPLGLLDAEDCRSRSLSIEIGDLTLDELEENEVGRARVQKHISDIATRSVFPTSFLILNFLTPTNPFDIALKSYSVSSAPPVPYVPTFSIVYQGKILPLKEFLSQKGRLAGEEIWSCLAHPVGSRRQGAKEKEERPIVKMEVDWHSLGRWISRYLLSVSLLSALIFGGLSCIGSLPTSFDHVSSSPARTRTSLPSTSTSTPFASSPASLSLSASTPVVVPTLSPAPRLSTLESSPPPILCTSVAVRETSELARVINIAKAVSASVRDTKGAVLRVDQEPKKSSALMMRPKGDLVELKEIATEVLAGLSEVSDLSTAQRLPAGINQNLSIIPHPLYFVHPTLALFIPKSPDVSSLVSPIHDLVAFFPPTITNLLASLQPYISSLNSIISTLSFYSHQTADGLSHSTKISFDRAGRGLRISEATLQHLADYFGAEPAKLMLLVRHEMRVVETVAETVAERAVSGAKRGLREEKQVLDGLLEEGKEAAGLTVKRSTRGLRRIVDQAKRIAAMYGLDADRGKEGLHVAETDV